MKNKVSVVLTVLLLVFLVAVAGLSIDNHNLRLMMTEKEAELSKTQNERMEMSNKLYSLTSRMADLTSASQKTLNKEEDCALRAKKIFLDYKDDEGGRFSYSTYSSHWNILDKACYMQINLKEKLQSGTVVSAGFGVYDITNDKQKISCFILSDLTDTTTMKTCENSLLKAQDYMSN